VRAFRNNRVFSILAFASVSLPFLLGHASAGTYDDLYFIGFSKDGRYLAFETYGTGDCSGYGYSVITFVNTEKNDWASNPISTVIDDETRTVQETRQEARGVNKKKAFNQISNLGIVDGNVGAHVVSRLLTDLTTFSGPIRFAKEIGSMYRHGDYELTLKEMVANSKECSVSDEPKIFELILKNKETNKTKVLQKDRTIPRSRRCANSYQISDVFIYNNYIAVFLNMFIPPGYEGPDMRYLVVTGTLE